MGLFIDRHYHSHVNDNSVRFPDRIDVNEYKAPTDESIKMWEEMQAKIVEKIIAKVEVSDNLVSGTVYAIDRLATTMMGIQLIFKFKINGHEFVVERVVDESEFYKNGREISHIQQTLKDHTKSVTLWYALKSFVAVAYEQITNQKPPELFFK